MACIQNVKHVSKPTNYEKVKKGAARIEFLDQFSGQRLNLEKWRITRKGDFRENIIDIFDVDPGQGEDHRLRLRADTIGTRDDTVKYHGVICLHKIEFAAGKMISVDLDWNKQANGCYLTAAIYICPTITDGNPLEENDWLRIEYIGVPPGRNARCAISTRTNKKTKHLYREGWPKKREGRYITHLRIDIHIHDQGFEVFEEGRKLCGSESHGLSFSSGYLYLQMSSHSNYPSREIYFDNVKITNSKPLHCLDNVADNP